MLPGDGTLSSNDLKQDANTSTEEVGQRVLTAKGKRRKLCGQ